jgi:uncharacterized protein (TIGR02594 family)
MGFVSFLKRLFRKKRKPVQALPPIEQEPEWMTIAKNEIGVKEHHPGDNKRIVEYHMATSLRATHDSVAWCSSFICWCLEQAKIVSPRSARARDFLEWGIKLHFPKPGCIVVFKRDLGGHVGLYVYETEDHVYVLGGNQSQMVNVSPYKKENLLGYRWPKL